MNQEKIGKFIADSRKKKKYTQQTLAEKLGVTDRAISNWENGKNLPDISLFEPICKELDITLNELISGEKISQKELTEKSEENIMKTINYTTKSKKKSLKKVTSIFIIIILIICLIIGVLILDFTKMINNEPVVFSTWGIKYAPAIELEESEIYHSIKKALIEKESIHLKTSKTFVALKPYLIEANKDNTYNVYAWVLSETYHYKDEELRLESGYSIPHKFIIKKENSTYVIKEYIIPKDGSYYKKSMKEIFPYSVRKEIEKVHINGTIKELNSEIKNQVELYYHIKLDKE